MQRPCGTSKLEAVPSSAANLGDRVADERFPARVAAIAEKVAAANDQQTVHALFQQGVAALGATSAVFVSFVRDDGDLAACRFMLACDPHWARLYVQEGHFAHDPWLAYAAHHSEPVVASTLNVLDGDHQRVIQLAARAGFVSAVLVPAHSGAGHSRISLLCLGSASPGYYEDAGLLRLRVSARMLALELHDWWLSRIRRDLIAKARITAADLILLQHECQGHGSKKIATELQVSTSSINSRFQRMNAKLGLADVLPGDEALTEALMQLLAQGAVDFTIFWRRLSLAVAVYADPAQDPRRVQAAIEPVRDLFVQREAFDAWAQTWRERLRAEPGFDPAAIQARMLATNPQVVLRNHLGEIAIQRAREGDFSRLQRLQAALEQPFDALPGCDDLADFPPEWAAQIEISCSS